MAVDMVNGSDGAVLTDGVMTVELLGADCAVS